MEGKNYWRLRRFSLFYKYYAFVDTEEYLGDQLFIQQKVEVSFGKEFGKKGNDYLIIFGSIIFFVGLTLPRYRFSKPSASLDMNLR